MSYNAYRIFAFLCRQTLRFMDTMSEQSTFCASNIDNGFQNDNDWNELHPTASAFMKSLALSRQHPLCGNESSSSDGPLPDELLGSDLYYESNLGVLGNVYTVFCQIAPPLLAMAELWLRLFAFVLAPLAILYLCRREVRVSSSRKQNYRKFLVSVVGLASCLVLTTDSMYVHAFGRTFGLSLFIVMVLVVRKNALAMRTYKRRTLISLAASLALTAFLLCKSASSGTGLFDDPGIDTPTIKEGLYYSERNELIKKIVELWPEQSRTYNVKNGATPYLLTGDSLTGIPFLVNSSPEQHYYRVWVQIPNEDEAVALDIAFPPNGIHSYTKPVVLVLHGLNGGSHEEYVREFVSARTHEGHTCVVMIARGIMDTPVAGWNVFHGGNANS